MARRQSIGSISALALANLSGSNSAVAPGSADDLKKLDGIAQADLIKKGHMSAAEAVQAALARIEEVEPAIVAFVDIAPEQALDAAASIDLEAPLAGLPFAIKDLTSYPGLKFERGSKLFEGSMGDERTPYVEKIDASGVVVLGKTTTPEFGLLGTTEPRAYKPTRNPWNTDHSCGGSSGGAAAAVAARVMPIAQASDGGGSIRNPASCCGIFGLKPTRGRFPDQGNKNRGIEISIMHAVSLSVRDNALMLALTEEQNGTLDPVGLVAPSSVAPKRIAVTVNDQVGNEPHPDVGQAVERYAGLLQELGHEVELVEEGPGLPKNLYDDFIILWGEAVVPIAELAEEESGKSARESGLIEGWTVDLAEHYSSVGAEKVADAMQRLNTLGENLRNWLSGYDAWLTPSTARPAPVLGWTHGDLQFAQNLERSTYLVGHHSIHNLAGTPGVSIPAGFSGGLPIAVQLSGAMGSERTLLELSYQLEEAAPWADRLPDLLSL